jgi:hypothetical protein
MNIMEFIKGYKYTTEQEAIDARKQCADYYGLPVSPEDVTQYYVDYNEASLDTPIFWYIEYYQGTEPILGKPTEFEIITQD